MALWGRVNSHGRRIQAGSAFVFTLRRRTKEEALGGGQGLGQGTLAG